MLYIVLAFISLHILFVLVVLAGFHKALAAEKKVSVENKSISVVVPFRNEAANLESLVQGLKQQQYPSFEVILVDDQSEDESVGMALHAFDRDSRFKVIRSSAPGKKQALTSGIYAAAGEIIVTTDADCAASPEWLQEINHAFSPEVDLVFGPVMIESINSFFSTLQQLEFAAVVGTGVGAYGLGHPVFCNGANLAFRRRTFDEVGGYEGNFHIVSGDDEFMLRKVLKSNSRAVSFLTATSGIVRTKPQPSLGSFIHQRIRWAAKWSAGSDTVTKALAISIFLIQCIVLVSWALVILGHAPFPVVFALGAKMLLEFILISTVLAHAKRKTAVFPFLVLTFCYPIYVAFTGLLSNFVGFTWKGRRHVR